MGRFVAKEVFVAGEMCVLLNTTLVTPAADGDKSAMIVIFLFEGACNGNEHDLFLYLMLVTREWY